MIEFLQWAGFAALAVGIAYGSLRIFDRLQDSHTPIGDRLDHYRIPGADVEALRETRLYEALNGGAYEGAWREAPTEEEAIWLAAVLDDAIGGLYDEGRIEAQRLKLYEALRARGIGRIG